MAPILSMTRENNTPVIDFSTVLVIFSTTDFSFHGHPDPLECPEEVKRRSIALYFYTNGRPAHEVNSGNRVSTDYRERPGEVFEKKEKSIASKFAARVRKVFKG